jgi:hypothetical protein
MFCLLCARPNELPCTHSHRVCTTFHRIPNTRVGSSRLRHRILTVIRRLWCCSRILSRRSRRSTAFCLVLACASLASCSGDAVGPHHPATHAWVLRTVDGHDLPFVFDSTSGVSTQVFDTLTMDIYTDTARDLQLAVKSPGSVGPSTALIGFKGTYSLAGDSIEIRWLAECPPLCVQNEKGSIDGPVMTLTADADISPRVLYVYERVH